MGQSSNTIDQKAKTQLVIRKPTVEEIAIGVRAVRDLNEFQKRKIWETTLDAYFNIYPTESKKGFDMLIGDVDMQDLIDKDFCRDAGISYSKVEDHLKDIRMGIVKYYHDRLTKAQPPSR